ncbi:DUF308 domain-containing protein [Curtobacterium sp. A7_M15]|uniref:HdeD family acid-resistance protein n=1 Tax=Curtobacterium sp. A7_M15 TaxID=3065241 RepID=UPI002737E59A|nr:DUF308 domain-containing protein [Curtobacterium sp. A7_M15]MDP4331987.1 DUF308 domain-containing protein [Curtobacterium sp. A7_M15]
MSTAHDTTGFTLDAHRLEHTALRTFRIAFGISGAAAIVIGIVLLIWPAHTLVVVAAAAGIYFAVTGIIRVVVAITATTTSTGHRILSIVLGLFLLAAGIIALRNLQVAAVTLVIVATAVIGIGWVIEGVLALAESRGPRSGWSITFGVLSIIAGIIVAVTPVWSAIWLLTFTAISLIILGIIAIIRAATLGRKARTERP